MVPLSMLPQHPPSSPKHDDGAPEPNALPTEAADNIEMPLPSNPQTFFLCGLLALAILAAVYVASSIILPVALAFVLQLILQPAVRLLERVRLPRAVRSTAGDPAGYWGTCGLCGSLVRTRREVGGEIAGGHTAPGNSHGRLEAPNRSAATSHPTGRARRRRSRKRLNRFGSPRSRSYGRAEVLPNFGDKRQAVDISQQIEADISAYLVTVTAMNAAVGVTTAVAMYLCGLGDPLLWGAAAFLLNYVPILGPLFGTVILLLAGMLSFDSLWWALLPPALYFGIHLAEGETLAPMLLARRVTLNPVLVILSLVFWFWMWGVPGAILAVPMLAILKIVSDRARPLKALGHVLEG